MAGENVVSYTDMDIDVAINDLSNRLIDEILLSKTITYAAKQPVIKTSKKRRFAHFTRKRCIRGEAYRLRENN